MAVRTFNAADDFVQHRTSTEGGGYFKTWKDRDKELSTLDAFLHTTQLPMVAWVHNIPLIKVIEDKDTKVTQKRVFGEKRVCWEDEELLKRQYFRDKHTGERKTPPRACGLCRLWDWVRFMIDDGKLDLVAPLFRFESDKKDETRIVHAGGFASYFKSDKLDDAQKAKIKKAGIRLDEAWAENGASAATYIFTLVNADKIEDGVTVYQEGPGLGDKVQTVIADAMSPKALGPIKGDPFKHPYCIQFQNRPKEKVPADRYHATRLEGVKMTPKIEKLIRDPQTAPDISNLLQPFNQASMRAYLERHCLLPKGTVPWAELFAGASAEDERTEEEIDESIAAKVYGGRGERLETMAESEEPENFGLGPLTEPDAEGAVYDKDGVEVQLCDEPACEKPNLVTDKRCRHCGKVYEEEQAPPPPPPPKMRTRSSAPPKPAPIDTTKRAPLPPPKGGGGSARPSDPDEGDEDRIPF
jgi:hypothetical protein